MTSTACETPYPSVHFLWTLFYWIRMVRVVPEEPSHSIPQCIAPTYVSMYVRTFWSDAIPGVDCAIGCCNVAAGEGNDHSKN